MEALESNEIGIDAFTAGNEFVGLSGVGKVQGLPKRVVAGSPHPSERVVANMIERDLKAHSCSGSLRGCSANRMQGELSPGCKFGFEQGNVDGN